MPPQTLHPDHAKPKCAGCGKPSTTLYCDRCAPPTRARWSEPEHIADTHLRNGFHVPNLNAGSAGKAASDE